MFSLGIVLAAVTAACSGPAPAPAQASAAATPPAAPSPDRRFLLERVDDAAVVQLYADGFPACP